MGNFLSTYSNVEPSRKYGWIKDRDDSRDEYTYLESFRDIEGLKIPRKVDLRDKFPSVYNQGALGSCTANAISGLYEYTLHKEKEYEKFIPSRLFIYYNERDLEGTIDVDSGAQLRDGLKSIKKIGVCNEREWPYIISKFKNKPTKECYKDAEIHKLLSYKKIPQNLSSLKKSLSLGNPFVFGFNVYENFETKEVEETGIMSLPTDGDKILGGHAVLAVGYCDDKKCFIIRNSWGKDWGEGGYFYMPYNFIKESKYCNDFWTINKVYDINKKQKTE